jgi:hypothetical protein
MDHGEADGLGEVTLAAAGRAEEESVLGTSEEAAGGELEDECAIDLGVEGEVEAVERLARVAEVSLLVSSSPTSAETRSIGAQWAFWASSSRISRWSAMPERRSLRSAGSSSVSFMSGLLVCGDR